MFSAVDNRPLANPLPEERAAWSVTKDETCTGTSVARAVISGVVHNYKAQRAARDIKVPRFQIHPAPNDEMGNKSHEQAALERSQQSSNLGSPQVQKSVKALKSSISGACRSRGKHGFRGVSKNSKKYAAQVL